MSGTREHTETVIIGAGQGGLAAAYHLSRHGRPYILIDAIGRIGDNWRCHYDSLRLYSPAKADGLPGLPMPGPPMAYPTKDDMADYLEAYAEHFGIRPRLGVRVRKVVRDGDGFVVHTDGPSFACANVIVATGTFGRQPNVPGFAADLDPDIVQLHSSEYRNPGQLRPGPVLVVGASHSGGDLAYEVASAGHPTVLSGPIRGEVPFDINGPAARAIFPVLLWLARHVLTIRTPVGRKMRPEVRAHGGPLIRVKQADLRGAGVELVAERTVGLEDGRPVLADGRVVDVPNVLWCTGFKQDFTWIDAPVTGPDGWPLEHRGIATSVPGLYFVGLAFQFAFASTLIGGAGADAGHVVDHIVARRPALGWSGGRRDDGGLRAQAGLAGRP
jgi:putative flavoprotein involved in K+ transport